MWEISQVLYKVIVKAVYKAHGGFLLLLFFVFFGLVPPAQVYYYHRAIAFEFAHSLYALSFLLGFVSLYAGRTWAFQYQLLQRPALEFLKYLTVYPFPRLLALLFFQQWLILFPFLVYLLMVAGMALSLGYYLNAFLIFLCLLVWAGLGSGLFYFTIKGTLRLQEAGLSRRIISPNIFSARPSLLILGFLWFERKGSLLLTKVFSYVLLIYLIPGYDPEIHEISYLYFVWSLIIFGQAKIIYEIYFFERKRMRFWHDLALGLHWRLWAYTLTFALLLMPEILLLISFRSEAVALSHCLALYALAISLCLGLRVLLMLRSGDLSTYFLDLLLLFFFHYLAQAFLLPIGLTLILILLPAILLFYLNYYRYS